MESDVSKALKAVESIQPEVIIMEESTGRHQPMRLGAFLHSATGGRVVTLSLDHGFATVYDRQRLAAADPVELVKAIQGVGKQGPGPDRHTPKASMIFQPASGANRDESRPARAARVRRTRKYEAQNAQDIARASRARKGG